MAAGLPRIGPTPLCIGLPEEIFTLEILVRLPPKDLVRCRAVCRAASARDFLVTHHRHQPSLHLVVLPKQESTWGDICALDLWTAGEARLQPIARINGSTAINVEASCDGLLLLSIGRVPEIHGFTVTGMYQHPPTGEYRLLLHSRSKAMDGENERSYVFALGCNQLQPTCNGCSPELACFFPSSVLVRGNLHWTWWPYPASKEDQTGKTITVFDTTSEEFRMMHSPVVQTSRADLFDVDGTLGIYSNSDSMTTIDIWVMQDYDSEIWSHKYHVKLPVAEIKEPERQNLTVVHEEGMCLSSTTLVKHCFLLTLRGNCSQVCSWMPISSF